MALVALVPLVVSHLILIGINRESLSTLEEKYLTRSAVQISNDLSNLLVSNRQQMTKIAGSILMMRKALPAGTDPFTYAAQTGWIADSITPDGDLIAIRALNAQGQGAEAVPAQLDRAVITEMAMAQKVALAGNESTGRILHLTARNEPVMEEKRRRALEFIKKIESGEIQFHDIEGKTDVAKNHDKYLNEGQDRSW